jgi:hypothetical protein
MWQYKGVTVREGRTWVGVVNGAVTQMSPQWHLWSASEKAEAGLVEIIPEVAPDDRFYIWTQNPDGTINKTAKDIADVKDSFIQTVKTQQGSLLAQTDWAIVRKADAGTAVPVAIQTWRDAIRVKAAEMETAIAGAADEAAIIALFVVFDSEGNKSGLLYDWPEDPDANNA